MYSLQLLVFVAFLSIVTRNLDAKPTEPANILLLRMVPVNKEQLTFLKSLKKNRRGLRLQFWRHPDQILHHVDMWISIRSLQEFVRLSEKHALKHIVLCNNIEKKAGKPVITMNNIQNYDSAFHTYEDIISEIRRLAIIYKTTLSADVIGTSSEGRDIYKVHVHRNASHVKPIHFVLCGTHSREWLSISSCQYLIRKLVFDNKYDFEIAALLNKYDVVVVPVLNPDGYQFTFDKSRLWRKSRSPTTNDRCRGVDINRNFNYRWGGGGSSPDPCEEIYCGVKPFSESESLSVARYLYKIRRNLVSFMDIHTYGQLWMSPWGFTTGYPHDFKRQEEVLKEIQRAIKKKNGVDYKIGRSASTLYQTSGDAIDWVYGTFGVVHTYGIELRPQFSKDRSFNGFERNRREIIPTAKDLLVGLKTLGRFVVNERNIY